MIDLGAIVGEDTGRDREGKSRLMERIAEAIDDRGQRRKNESIRWST